jgi:RNase H-fold protein (predicted Holliday junction resolvase)
VRIFKKKSKRIITRKIRIKIYMDLRNQLNMSRGNKRRSEFSINSDMQKTRRKLEDANDYVIVLRNELDRTREALQKTRKKLDNAARITMRTITIDATSRVPIMAIVGTPETRQDFIQTFMQSNGCIYCDNKRQTVIIVGSPKNVADAGAIFDRNIASHRERLAKAAALETEVPGDEVPEAFKFICEVDIPV